MLLKRIWKTEWKGEGVERSEEEIKRQEAEKCEKEGE